MRERCNASHVSSFCLFILILISLSLSVSAQVSVVTRHGDNARTGANLNEPILNVSNVNSSHFGRLAYRPVDGNVYAQPLIASGVQAAGRRGTRNLAIVATEHNSIYAFDADDVDENSASALVWHAGPDVLGSSIETQTLFADMERTGCPDLTPEVGITGTPVIGLTNGATPRDGTIFVAAKSKSGDAYHYKLFALRLSDGAKVGSIEIEGEVAGKGRGSVGDGDDAKLRFNPKIQLNRPGLLLAGNILYVAFGGHCDFDRYHGWLFAYDVSNPQAIRLVSVLCTTPNSTGPNGDRDSLDGGAGIWMAGEGPSADAAGRVYFVTGNGSNDKSSEFGDSVIQTVLHGGRLQVPDWFSPENQDQLKITDFDLGSSGVVLLPESRVVVAAGKEGRLYLLDRDQLGKGAGAPLDSVQVTQVSVPPRSYGLFGTPVVWQRGDHLFLYTAGVEDPVRQYRLVRDFQGAGWKLESQQPFKSSVHTEPYPNFPGGSVTLSASGAREDSGILWVLMPVEGNASVMSVRGRAAGFRCVRCIEAAAMG